jgi:site-specific DNA recombinase
MGRHVFKKANQLEANGRKRAMLYLRVSTGRQATNDVSLPSQREIDTNHCIANNWIIVGEYVEAATATDDRRPAFQEMMERACDPDKDFDLIVVYSFNRFFRNGADMELAIRKLRKHGVEVVSVTQPTGDDHSRELMRQLIGVFDEHISREISKNTTRRYAGVRQARLLERRDSAARLQDCRSRTPRTEDQEEARHRCGRG